ncbi:MAG: S8 family serine peptidase [Euryarchaeota archaeon]|nr:S8 family serine peptidase [Euryarchaeota archaeon]
MDRGVPSWGFSRGLRFLLLLVLLVAAGRGAVCGESCPGAAEQAILAVEEPEGGVHRVAHVGSSNASYIVEFDGPPLAVAEGEVDRAMEPLGPLGRLLGKPVKWVQRQLAEEFQRGAEEDIAALAEEAPPRVARRFHTVFNGLSVNATIREAEAIRRLPYVRAVHPDGTVEALLNFSVGLIGAPGVWSRLDGEGRNLTGRGVAVAILDTGVDYTHPDLGNCTREVFRNGTCAKVVGGYDLVNSDGDPMDDHGHGTHVAATAAGDGLLRGVAPGATLRAYKVLNQYGSGSWSQVIAGIERAVDPDQDGDSSDRADIISMSLGGRGNADDPVSRAVDRAVEAGVIVTVAAGNSGPRPSTIQSPGTARLAITVGASDDRDNIAWFSSRGPTGLGLVKPDLVAPGVAICAAEWASAWADRRCLDNRHVELQGTSMATPHVAGAAALLKQLHPDWSPREVKAALKNTARDLGLDRNIQGAGRLDAGRAAGLNSTPLVAEFNTSHYSPRVTGPLDLRGTATGAGLLGWELRLENGSGSRLLQESNHSIENGGLLSGWDAGILPDGTYTLRLVARGPGGDSEDRLQIEVDNVKFQFPANRSPVGPGDVSLLGTARGPRLHRYTLDVGDGESPLSWNNTGITLAGGGLQPVDNGTLATLNLTGYEPRRLYAVRLRAFDPQGALLGADTLLLHYDPALRPGFPVQLPRACTSLCLALTSAPTIGDVNGDGAQELLVAYDSHLYVLNANGTPLPGWPKNVSPGMIQTGPAVADLDGDGQNDILQGSSDGTLYAWSANGTPLPGWPRAWPRGAIESPTVADLDGDGAPEAVVNAWNGQTLAIRSNSTPWWTTPSVGDFLFSIPAVGDITGDGRPEVVVATYSGRLMAYRSNGTPLWTSPILTGSTMGYVSPALGDLDGDGAAEVVAGNLAGDLYVLHGNGSNMSGWPRRVLLGGRADPLWGNPALGDLDGDGTLDIVVGGDAVLDTTVWRRASALHAYHANGTPLRGWPVKVFDNNSWTFHGFGSPALGDLDGDGRPEALAQTDEDYLYAFHGNGTPVAGWPKYTGSISAWPSNTPALGDLDGDGRLDVAAVTYANQVLAWSLDGPHREARLPWSMVHGDRNHTGLAPIPRVEDTQPPEMEAPGDLWVEPGELLQLRVRARDNGSGMAHVTANVSSLNASLPPLEFHPGKNDTWTSPAFTIDPGPTAWLNLTLTAEDNNSNLRGTSQRVHRLNASETRPRLRATPGFTNTTRLNVSLEAGCANPLFSGYEVRGGALEEWTPTLENGTFEFPLVPDARNTLSVRCRYISGSTSGSDSAGVVQDSTPPLIRILFPAEGETLGNLTEVMLTGEVMEVNRESRRPNASPGLREEYSPLNGTFRFRVPLAGETALRLTVEFTDDAGNRNQTTRTLRFDREPPRLLNQTPPDGAALNRTPIVLEADILDATRDEAGVNGENHTSNATRTPIEGGYRLRLEVNATDGPLHLTLGAWDNHSNPAWSNRSILVDTQPPAFTLYRDVNGRWLPLAPRAHHILETRPTDDSAALPMQEPEPADTRERTVLLALRANGTGSPLHRVAINGAVLQPRQDGLYTTSLEPTRENRTLEAVVEDAAGNTKSAEYILPRASPATRTAEASRTTPPGPPAGGGGGAAPPPLFGSTRTLISTPSKLPRLLQALGTLKNPEGTDLLEAHETGTARFPDSEVREVKLQFHRPASGVTVHLQPLPEPPDTRPAPGLAYQYMEITPSGVEDSRIREATITFQVDRDWMETHNATPSTIRLARFHLDNWSLLPTTPIREENHSTLFEAMTPGFSTFAIVSHAPEPPGPPPPSAPKKEESPSTPIHPNRTTVDETPQTRKPVAAAIVSTLVAFLAALFRRGPGWNL